MKRKVAGVLAAAMAAGMLAGCGSSAKPADTTAAKAEDTKAAEGSTEAAAAVTRSLSSSGTAWVLPTEN